MLTVVTRQLVPVSNQKAIGAIRDVCSTEIGVLERAAEQRQTARALDEHSSSRLEQHFERVYSNILREIQDKTKKTRSIPA